MISPDDMRHRSPLHFYSYIIRVDSALGSSSFRPVNAKKMKLFYVLMVALTFVVATSARILEVNDAYCNKAINFQNNGNKIKIYKEFIFL